MKEKIINALKWFYKSYIWLFLVLLGLDIATKQIVLHMPVNSEGHIAEWGFVNISFVLNYNAAFGIGASDHALSRIIYLIVASLVSVGLIVYLILKRKTMKLYIRACLIMIVTGALGNMIDRIFYGPEYAVVDWIDFYWFWPFVFNIADCCIVISAFMLIIYIIITEVKDVIARRKAEEQAEQKTIDTKEQEFDDNNSSDSSDSGDSE